MGDIEKAYANVHLNRAIAILNGHYGMMASYGHQPHQEFTDTDRQAFRAELERALALVEADGRPALNVVSPKPL